MFLHSKISMNTIFITMPSLTKLKIDRMFKEILRVHRCWILYSFNTKLIMSTKFPRFRKFDMVSREITPGLAHLLTSLACIWNNIESMIYIFDISYQPKIIIWPSASLQENIIFRVLYYSVSHLIRSFVIDTLCNQEQFHCHC